MFSTKFVFAMQNVLAKWLCIFKGPLCYCYVIEFQHITRFSWSFVKKIWKYKCQKFSRKKSIWMCYVTYVTIKIYKEETCLNYLQNSSEFFFFLEEKKRFLWGLALSSWLIRIWEMLWCLLIFLSQKPWTHFCFLNFQK